MILSASIFSQENDTIPIENEFIDSTVYWVINDTSGTMWFGTVKGISSFSNGIWVSYDSSDGLPASGQIYEGVLDNDGNLIISVFYNGIYKFENNEFVNIFTTSINTWGLAVDWDGNIWFGAFTQVVQITPDTSFSYSIRESIGGSYTVSSILIDLEGNVWVSSRLEGIGWGGTTDAVLKYDGNEWTSFTLDDGLLSQDVHELAVDNSNNVWIGSSRGLNKYDGNSIISMDSLLNFDFGNISSIYFDDDGNTYIISSGDLVIYNGTTVETIDSSNGLNDYYFLSQIEDDNGNIWLTTWNDGVIFIGNAVDLTSTKIFPKIRSRISIDQLSTLNYDVRGRRVRPTGHRSFLLF